MRLSHSRSAATIIVGLFVAAACSSAASAIPDVTPSSPRELRDNDASHDRAPTPVVAPIPSRAAALTASPTKFADATLRVVDLTAILDVAQA